MTDETSARTIEETEVDAFTSQDDYQDVSYLEPGMWPNDPEQEALNAERLAAWKRDEWTNVCLFVRVTLTAADGFTKTYSAALGAIESDSERDYFQSTAAEMLAELNSEIEADGFEPIPQSALPRVKFC